MEEGRIKEVTTFLSLNKQWRLLPFPKRSSGLPIHDHINVPSGRGSENLPVSEATYSLSHLLLSVSLNLATEGLRRPCRGARPFSWPVRTVQLHAPALSSSSKGVSDITQIQRTFR